jgi:hypothetical protein
MAESAADSEARCRMVEERAKKLEVFAQKLLVRAQESEDQVRQLKLRVAPDE